jgi:hypothetical protein
MSGPCRYDPAQITFLEPTNFQSTFSSYQTCFHNVQVPVFMLKTRIITVFIDKTNDLATKKRTNTIKIIFFWIITQMSRGLILSPRVDRTKNVVVPC